MAKLNEVERKTLNEYLVEHRQRITDQKLTCTEVASQVREVLKIDASESNITARVGNTGRLYFHEWPGSATSRAGRANSVAGFNQLVQQVECLRSWANHAYHLLRDFGHTISPPTSIPEWMGLKNQASAQLADTDLREPEEKD